ncbi:MAG: DUF1015 family protein [Gammaproteobacteria bacterium]|nr:DUF1015 family protein [Gammaproteobacteria bacterium]
MPTIKPFRGLRPAPDAAQQVIAPPYDVVTTEEARAFARGNPLNFLHVSRPEIDLSPGTPPYGEAVYQAGAKNFAGLISRQTLCRDARENFYVYRLSLDGRQQTGLVGVVSVVDYRAGRVRKHEHTRPEKENDRIAHMEALNAQTGPTMMVYRQVPGATELLTAATREVPDHEALQLQGAEHSLWVVRDDELIQEFKNAFEDLPVFYIADGHHRSAAAAQVAARRARAVDDPSQFFLAVVFPANEMNILDYNRVVRDLGDMSGGQFLQEVARRFALEPHDGPVRPERNGEFGLYVDGNWYRLMLRDEFLAAADPIERLDVRRLETHVFTPILNITDPRTDPRIDFVGGRRGLRELERRVDQGGMRAAFSLFPTSLEELMSVADSGAVMPPKSTWFEPKLADGLVAYMLD